MCLLRQPTRRICQVFCIDSQIFANTGSTLTNSGIFYYPRRGTCIGSSGQPLTKCEYNIVNTTNLRHNSSNTNTSNSCTINEMLNHLPFFSKGEIVRGFGRGSSELGIPTANYPLEVVKALPSAFPLGIYYGWANVDNGDVYKMVMSIGTNPYYDNKENSMETHIMHKFDGDLYGHLLKVCIVGYLRPERNFDSLEDLITAIQRDIEEANHLLDSDEESRQLQYSKFFKACDNNTKPKTTHLNGDNMKNGS